MKWSKYNTAWSDHENAYLYNSIHDTLAVKSLGPWELTDNATLVELEQSGFLVRDDALEAEEARKVILQKLHMSDSLSCWVFLTNDCNLSCPYCFEKDSLLNGVPEYMTHQRCEQTVAWLVARAQEKNVQRIDVTLTGGEPLLNLEAIETLADLLKDTGFAVTINVITNGVLLSPAIVKRLYLHGICSYQVTLDGLSKVHDARRQYKDGTGTFSTIIQNILAAKQWNGQVQFVIRINVDHQNCGDIFNLLSFLKKMQLEHIVAICVNDTIEDHILPSAEILQKNVEIISRAIDYGFQVAFGELNNCWMMSEFWYMINVDGSLYKCPSLVGREEYRVGSITGNGGLGEGERQMNLTPWEACLDCALVGMCCGGCSYRSLLKTGEWGGGKVCRKSYLEAILKLKYSCKSNAVRLK